MRTRIDFVSVSLGHLRSQVATARSNFGKKVPAEFNLIQAWKFSTPSIEELKARRRRSNSPVLFSFKLSATAFKVSRTMPVRDYLALPAPNVHRTGRPEFEKVGPLQLLYESSVRAGYWLIVVRHVDATRRRIPSKSECT